MSNHNSTLEDKAEMQVWPGSWFLFSSISQSPGYQRLGEAARAKHQEHPVVMVSTHSELINSLTAQPGAPTESGPARGSQAGEVVSSKGKEPSTHGLHQAHQVNRWFTEHRQLSFSLCQEPLETLYEDN
ncbi:Hypothetical predicted protein [Marmota monax]|uniref:Uncharacterized protein n=1 Tax=Marmota monax TaxID=9995 RepID=A0A5E4C5G7_MARMO|nr:hypothetical protein GHT09_004740 [Marmota monax]VTJ77108.1 Hypothetical predicted protein [Marmota monax]